MTLRDADKENVESTTDVDQTTAEGDTSTHRAGIIFADEQETESARLKRAAQAAYAQLSWEELLEQINTAFPDRDDLNEQDLTAYRDALNGAFGTDAFVVPKVENSASQNNAQIFVELFDTLKRGSGSDFAPVSGHGLISISQKGIFFDPAKNKDETKPFTQEEARQIALIAMHNKDLLPPNEIKITGSDQERALIKKEVELLNQLLPENARFTIANAADIPDVEYETIHTAEHAPAPFDINDLPPAPVAPPPAPRTRSELNQEFNKLDKLKGERLLRDIESNLINMISKDELKIMPIGKDGIFEVEVGQNQPQFEGIRFEARKEDKTDLEIVFMPAYEDRPAWVLHSYHIPNDNAISAPTSSPKAPLSQSHPDFIGPREFAGPQIPKSETNAEFTDAAEAKLKDSIDATAIRMPVEAALASFARANDFQTDVVGITDIGSHDIYEIRSGQNIPYLEGVRFIKPIRGSDYMRVIFAPEREQFPKYESLDYGIKKGNPGPKADGPRPTGP